MVMVTPTMMMMTVMMVIIMMTRMMRMIKTLRDHSDDGNEEEEDDDEEEEEEQEEEEAEEFRQQEFNKARGIDLSFGSLRRSECLVRAACLVRVLWHPKTPFCSWVCQNIARIFQISSSQDTPVSIRITSSKAPRQRVKEAGDNCTDISAQWRGGWINCYRASAK